MGGDGRLARGHFFSADARVREISYGENEPRALYEGIFIPERPPHQFFVQLNETMVQAPT